MQIVTDSGMDLSPQQLKDLDIHQLPLKITLDGKTYASGIDIQPEEFYDLIGNTESMPITSTPSPGDFVEVYNKLAEKDPEIISIHISSGLSGTFNAARTAAKMVKKAKVSLVDTLTLSGGQGWQVEAAARAAKAGWSLERILELIKQVKDASDTIYTLPDLKYLISGGRISHLKGLLASVLNLKPLLGVSKTDGKYNERGKKRSFARAIEAIPQVILRNHEAGTPIRSQIAHAGNPSGAERLHEAIDKVFKCEWLPAVSISPVLGAHTGRGLVGVVYAALSALPKLPETGTA